MVLADGDIGGPGSRPGATQGVPEDGPRRAGCGMGASGHASRPLRSAHEGGRTDHRCGQDDDRGPWPRANECGLPCAGDQIPDRALYPDTPPNYTGVATPGGTIQNPFFIDNPDDDTDPKDPNYGTTPGATLGNFRIFSLTLRPGEQLNWHLHTWQTSMIVVQKGVLTYETIKGTYETLPKGTAIVEPFQQVHRLANQGETDVVLTVAQLQLPDTGGRPGRCHIEEPDRDRDIFVGNRYADKREAGILVRYPNADELQFLGEPRECGADD